MARVYINSMVRAVSCYIAAAAALLALGADAARVKVKKALKKRNLLRTGVNAGFGESVSVKDGIGAEVVVGSELQVGTLPPEFWMWKTTPAPPTPPGPYPQVIWVPHV